VRQFRQDLLADEANQQEEEVQPIPKEMPPHFLDKHIPHVEGVGEPTTATFFTNSKINPTNWFVSLVFNPIFF